LIHEFIHEFHELSLIKKDFQMPAKKIYSNLSCTPDEIGRNPEVGRGREEMLNYEF